jgi:hypothetical protein
VILIHSAPIFPVHESDCLASGTSNNLGYICEQLFADRLLPGNQAFSMNRTRLMQHLIDHL